MLRTLALIALSLCSTVVAAEPATEEAKRQEAQRKAAELTAAAERRAAIPLGGDFRPDPKVATFVAVGHGGRIVVSQDDGATWKQTLFLGPGSDHGPWATKSVAYCDGVFVVAIGWGAPTIFLASDDGVNWRHLTAGTAKLPEAKGDPRVMPGTWSLAAGKGTVVAGGYMTMTATSDFGKTFSSFSLWPFGKESRGRSFSTHHVGPVYCGDRSGRFLALGNDRAKEGAVFGNLFASDDLGKTWKWLEPELLNKECQGYSGIACDGDAVVIVDKDGANAFRSTDGGDSWEGPFATGSQRGTLSVVKGEFWIAGKPPRASADGREWRDLPKGLTTGKIVASDRGTLVSVEGRRANVLRSTDGGETWSEVFSFTPETENVHGAQGLRDVAFGLVRPTSEK